MNARLTATGVEVARVYLHMIERPGSRHRGEFLQLEYLGASLLAVAGKKSESPKFN